MCSLTILGIDLQNKSQIIEYCFIEIIFYLTITNSSL